MSVTQVVLAGLACVFQPFARELTHGLQKQAPAGRLGDDQALIDEDFDLIEECARHGLGSSRANDPRKTDRRRRAALVRLRPAGRSASTRSLRAVSAGARAGPSRRRTEAVAPYPAVRGGQPGVSSRVRAAASSMASGRLSRRRQMAMTVRSRLEPAADCGRAAEEQLDGWSSIEWRDRQFVLRAEVQGSTRGRDDDRVTDEVGWATTPPTSFSCSRLSRISSIGRRAEGSDVHIVIGPSGQVHSATYGPGTPHRCQRRRGKRARRRCHQRKASESSAAAWRASRVFPGATWPGECDEPRPIATRPGPGALRAPRPARASGHAAMGRLLRCSDFSGGKSRGRPSMTS